MKIAFCIILGPNVSSSFFIEWTKCLTNLISQGHDVITSMYKGAYIDQNRHDAVQNALDANPDYIFSLETDHKFEYTDVLRLVNFLEKDPTKEIVSGLYFMKEIPHNPIPWVTEECILVEYPENDLIEIFCGGLGFAAIRPNVFKKLKKPWFQNPHYKNEDGEDLFFGTRLAEAGITWWMDTGLRIGHGEIYRDHYDKFKGDWLKGKKTIYLGKETCGLQKVKRRDIEINKNIKK